MTERGLYSIVSNIHIGYYTRKNKLHNTFRLLKLGSCLCTVTWLLSMYRNAETSNAYIHAVELESLAEKWIKNVQFK